ncbi:hypothetical protein TWF788_003157 [Orbilia oligospora]|uniref:Uncharacterized protein n=2 Tax=Orbilia oligospora TaxID=2813651 RepID=A0A7C8K0G2_ORBOL|nr:hypothetical protein TWF788_003157 [Orbilia oligospora]
MYVRSGMSVLKLSMPSDPERNLAIYRGWDSGCEQLATNTRQQTGYWLKDEQAREQARELEEPGTGAKRVGQPMEDSQHDEARIMPAYL